MDKKKVQVYFGKGKGKTTAAVGQCIRAASQGKSVIMIQFLKGKDTDEFSFLLKLEPSIKLFRFEKAHEYYRDLNEEERNEERKNILNGFNFARKVIETGECDVLVLDEILGLIDLDIITVDDIIKLINLKEDYYKLLLTGQNLPEQLVPYMDRISEIVPIKE
ncbi:cob(I)alamin adenosyltransferase [Mobilisporobacter senegalensis]|uniref:Cob(I)alamin adenosyltransferase n=1 Tax=Mobilisporobacter senegalensis TaxID=1329262 RepID=A0A3N1Y2L7_9FIRM|nr:cob(I)yrinic acid a,c-diamide adenosyltransferase [Mobilisporobacter senegalensis]ROR31507.1 cob(I)alamin adenosyltransferase [Mobilisporobacter senegalensis]